MTSMRAVLFLGAGSPLRCAEVPLPVVAAGQVLVEVEACGVCRTDLHILDGELPEPRVPLVPGHQVVGRVIAEGEGVESPRRGDIVGVPWLGWTCESCRYCTTGQENLCPNARFTGYTIDGGYAEYCIADARYCFPIPRGYQPLEAAP